jgi:hypothetical protein
VVAPGLRKMDTNKTINEEDDDEEYNDDSDDMYGSDSDDVDYFDRRLDNDNLSSINSHDDLGDLNEEERML